MAAHTNRHPGVFPTVCVIRMIQRSSEGSRKNAFGCSEVEKIKEKKKKKTDKHQRPKGFGSRVQNEPGAESRMSAIFTAGLRNGKKNRVV